MSALVANPMNAFDEHQAWLKRLHEQYEHHTAKVASQASPLPSAPMMWGRPEEANDVYPGFGAMSSGFGAASANIDDRFASIALSDDDFDAPVYRSLGGFMSESASGLDLAVEDESPRYRSAPVPEPLMSAEDVDAAWLARMPPLIRRQNALRPSITLP